MRHNREFEIAWQGLKPGVHTFQYELGDRFLDEHGANERDFKDLDAQVNLKFDKETNFFLCHFDIDGSVTVACDRCGDEFKLRLWDEFDLVIKLTGTEEAEMPDDDADVIFIPRNETVIDFANWIYEFIMLSIPLQRIHPDKPDGTPGCNPETLKLLNKLSEADEPKNAIWKGLEALKEKNKDNKRKTK
ncbi:MAG: DUF177 domain-containing protein [Bacteroidetes bacterium]|nr:DUF177 domain-containing protein [Bacteroidota bacterium]